MKDTRPIIWTKGARRDFEAFPAGVRASMLTELTIAAEGGMASHAKPFKGLGSGVFEVALKHRGDAFRAIYAVQLGAALYVFDAFQKKSKSGIKTPQADVDRIRERFKRLQEALA